MAERTLGSYFDSGTPPADQTCEVLAQDETGEYRLPFLCVWRDGAWYAEGKNKPLAAKIIGWRVGLPRKNPRQ